MGVKKSRLVLPQSQYKNLCIQVLKRDQWKCRICKGRKELSCHHVVYRSAGGDDAPWNLMALCTRCHDAIHARYVLVLPIIEGEVIDANKPVRLLFLAGWKPVQFNKKKAA